MPGKSYDVDPGSGSLTTQIPQTRAAWAAWATQRRLAAVATCALVLKGRSVALMGPEELTEAMDEVAMLLSALGLDRASMEAFISRWAPETVAS